MCSNTTQVLLVESVRTGPGMAGGRWCGGSHGNRVSRERERLFMIVAGSTSVDTGRVNGSWMPPSNYLNQRLEKGFKRNIVFIHHY